MLQITTGKFFRPGVDLYSSRQRGVLHSNYALDGPIETVAGTLFPSALRGDLAVLIYEVDERLESTNLDGTPSFLLSTGGSYLVEDFAAVASFALGITCTSDADLARRLTQSNMPALGMRRAPRSYVRRVFDQSINDSADSNARLKSFLSDLVALPRSTYEAVMRAIQRYVTGLHRVGDDADLAYSLLVASIESLAQGFDEFTPTWNEYHGAARDDIDEALVEAPAEVATRVREAILKHDHIKLSRRYREFAIAHVDSVFFRDDASAEARPVRRSELSDALANAYEFRSRYVHALIPLPDVITTVSSLANVCMVDQAPALTLQGMARVARHVIWEFVRRTPKLATEPIDYRRHLPNIVRGFQLAERYWIWRREGFTHSTSRRYLSGFLSEYAAVLGGDPDAHLTDIRGVLELIEEQIAGLDRGKRLPMLTLYLLFNRFVAPDAQRGHWERLVERFRTDFELPCPESLVAHVLTSTPVAWDLEEHERVLDSYRKRRYRDKALQLPALFEIALTLDLAERYRITGNALRARELVSFAVEDFPVHAGLRSFEERFAVDEELAVEWWRILLPPPPPPDPSDQSDTRSE